MKSTILLGVLAVSTMSFSQDQETKENSRPWHRTFTNCEMNNQSGNAGESACYELALGEATAYLNKLYETRIEEIQSQLNSDYEYKNEMMDSLLNAQLVAFQKSKEHFFKMREAQSEIMFIGSFDGSGAETIKLQTELELTEQHIISIEGTWVPGVYKE